MKWIVPSRAARGVLAAALAGILAAPPAADACTRVLWNNNKLGVYVGRTMDWATSTDALLTVFPRGMKRDGGLLGPQRVISENPARWTSRYGSLVTTFYGLGSADGVNERGLAGHLLYLKATDFGPRDAGKPGVHAGLWLQYLLDNAASVKEALALMDGISLTLVAARGREATVHLALEDASGDSAVVEFVGGMRVVHHGREYRIVTNDPPYDEQLALLAKQDFSQPSSATPLPGNVNARDRFQRAAYFSALLPEPKSEREAIAGVMSIVRNCSVPFGAPYQDFGIYNTEYRTAINLNARRYYFELTTAPNVIWADLTRFDLRPGAPVLTLDPDDVNLSGDVTRKFKRSKAPF